MAWDHGQRGCPRAGSRWEGTGGREGDALRSGGTKPLMLGSRTVRDRDASCTNRASSCSPEQAQQHPRKSECSEQRMLKGWGSADRSLLPKAKGSPTAPVPAPPVSSAPAGQDEEAGRALLPAQTTALALLPVHTAFKYIPTGNQDSSSGGGGVQSCRAPSLLPQHSAIYCSRVDSNN